MLSIPDLSGGGGAERFFADLHKVYKDQTKPGFNLFFFTDDSVVNLKKIGKMNALHESVLEFKDYRFSFFNKFTSRLFFIKHLAAYGRELITLIRLRRQIVENNIRIVHVTSFTRSYLFFLKLLQRLNSKTRPKIVLNIVDCRIPFWYFNRNAPEALTAATESNFAELFKTVPIAGVFSWYKNFVEFSKINRLIQPEPIYYAIKSRFTLFEKDIETSLSEKEKTVIYAARLDEQKDPFAFLYAVKRLAENHFAALSGWKFKLFGKGPLETECRKFIDTNNLGELVQHGYSSDLSEEFKKSSLFVSTQHYENFPSLSMAEAMVFGNAVIARKVGQTDYFLKDGFNGLFCSETADDLADRIMEYITQPEKHAYYSANSRQIILQEHSAAGFIQQIDAFWSGILKTSQ